MEEKKMNGEEIVDTQASFDKTLMLENIKAIAKRKQIPIGQLEQKAGVSTGYLSRQSSGTARIDFGTIVKIAQILGVSMDDLVYKNMILGLTVTEFKIYQFLDKLKRDTHDDTVSWSFYDSWYLNSCNQRMVAEFYNENEPPRELFKLIGNNEEPPVYSFVHQLNYFGYRDCYIEGPAFHAEINPYVSLYMTQVKYPIKTDEREKSKGRSLDREEQDGDIHSIELFLADSEKSEALCNSQEVSAALASLIKELRDEVDESTNRIHLSDFSKSVIDGYMDPAHHPYKGPYDKDIPF